MKRREKTRDNRDYDTTQLREAGHGRTLGRDYNGHFFRWSFARRLITAKDNVLEVGCGEDKPLSKILTGGAAAHVNTYVGVDLNKLKASNSQRLTFIGEFNFVERWKELLKQRPEGWDVLVHMEVLEHMHSRHQLPFLKACFACLKPGGVMLMSTPVYDGVRHAANHIAEVDVPTLQKMVEKAGFVVVKRWGVYMDIKGIGKAEIDPKLSAAVKVLRPALADYFDNDALSNFFAPIYPDNARNNLWRVIKPVK